MNRNFIEYCYSLNKCGRTISYFDPQHLLFLFDEKAGFNYPRIMFCGFGAVVEESKRYLMKRSMTFYEAIDSFGQYLLSHVISIPSNPVNKTYYSEPLIVWLRVMSGRDGGPQRYVDLENLVQMLWERIEAFQSPYAGLDKHPWLKDYFGQLQLELDTTFTYGTRLTFGPSEAAGMIKSYLTEGEFNCFE